MINRLRRFVKSSPVTSRMYRRYAMPFHIARGYLASNGYFNENPVDGAGDAIPWFSYPAIYFLKGAVQKDWKVLEYGGGNSTLFWNRECAKTVTVEHDPIWFGQLRTRNGSFEMHLVPEGFDRHRSEIADAVGRFEQQGFDLPLKGDKAYDDLVGLNNVSFANYAAKILDYPNGYFDVVVVDGMARCLSGFLAAERINDRGVIILDNSDRWQYNALQKYLIEVRKFRRIDFHGLCPLLTTPSTTSFFFKNDEFLTKTRVERVMGTGDLMW